jgi:hypothetical protein
LLACFCGYDYDVRFDAPLFRQEDIMKRLILYLFALLPIATLIGNAQIVGGVALEYDPAMLFTVEAGKTLQFELVARDTANNVIENWHTIGQNAVLAVHGTVAETDTNHRAWSADPLGFTWLELRLNGTVLTLDSVGSDQELYYSLPPSAFTFGKAALDFTLTCAGKDISLTITPIFGTLAQQSPPISIFPGPHDNYLVDLTSPLQGEDKVFLRRRFEIVVVPRDRYLNWISGRNIATTFTAVFPAEFDKSKPGVTNIFTGPVYINGPTNYFLMPRLRRLYSQGDDLQTIFARKSDDPAINGQSDPFEIIDHAPNPFALLNPPDHSQLVLYRVTDTTTFTWIRALPQDPYTDIQLSRFNPATYSDVVKYDISFVDASTLTRMVNFTSDSSGLAASFTTTHRNLAEIIHMLSGSPTTLEQTVIWYVTARDFDNSVGQMEGPEYATLSSPPELDPQSSPGYRLLLSRNILIACPTKPAKFALHQNFPNPFSPSTVIRVDLPTPAHCLLHVHNLVGQEVAILYEGKLDTGFHHFEFRSDGFPPGVYTYRLVVDGAVQARSMLLLR